jgi:hypothetical protein
MVSARKRHFNEGKLSFPADFQGALEVGHTPTLRTILSLKPLSWSAERLLPPATEVGPQNLIVILY